MIRLNAGPLSLLFEPESGFLRRVRYGEIEILRGVYGSVRDRNWDTIAPAISDLQWDQDADSFTLTFVAHCQENEIDFVWQGTLTGDTDGTLRYVFDGMANSTFLRNRIGFCVLHPIRECAGKVCRVTHSDGTVTDSVFPLLISPAQPFLDMQAIRHNVDEDTVAEVRFEGDVFEMEDQRNWTDASYKTYCTPLSRPYPAEVHPGDRVRQAVLLTLSPSSSSLKETGPKTAQRRNLFHRSPSPSQTNAIQIRLFTGRENKPLPQVGLGISEIEKKLSEKEIARLHAARPAHLRWDVKFGAGNVEADAEGVFAQARALDTALEIALHLTDAAEKELQQFASLIGEQKPPMARFLVFHQKEKSTSERWVRLAKALLQDAEPGVPVGAGTDAYFAELNRKRPPVAVCDFITYSLNPQVHAFDDLSLVEALEGQAETVRSAKAIARGLPVLVSPITLKPRFNPNATGEAAVRPDELPETVDARQLTPFGAAWTLGSLQQMAESGVHSVTYYETVGWRGLMEMETGSLMPQKFPSAPGAVFPLYHVLADIGEWRNAFVIPVEIAPAGRVAALLLQSDVDVFCLLLANLTDEAQQVCLWDVPSLPLRARRLDVENVETATQNPEAFRAERGTLLASEPETILTLPPHAYLRLASEI